jgi:hypothetical protein
MRCAQEIDECVPDFAGEGRHSLAYLSAVLTRPNVSPPQHITQPKTSQQMYVLLVP